MKLFYTSSSATPVRGQKSTFGAECLRYCLSLSKAVYKIYKYKNSIIFMNPAVLLVYFNVHWNIEISFQVFLARDTCSKRTNY